jgi:hypothetical protein
LSDQWMDGEAEKKEWTTAGNKHSTAERTEEPEEQKSRRAEEQKSRRAEEQKSRRAEEQKSRREQNCTEVKIGYEETATIVIMGVVNKVNGGQHYHPSLTGSAALH